MPATSPATSTFYVNVSHDSLTEPHGNAVEDGVQYQKRNISVRRGPKKTARAFMQSLRNGVSRVYSAIFKRKAAPAPVQSEPSIGPASAARVAVHQSPEHLPVVTVHKQPVRAAPPVPRIQVTVTNCASSNAAMPPASSGTRVPATVAEIHEAMMDVFSRIDSRAGREPVRSASENSPPAAVAAPRASSNAAVLPASSAAHMPAAETDSVERLMHRYLLIGEAGSETVAEHPARLTPAMPPTSAAAHGAAAGTDILADLMNRFARIDEGHSEPARRLAGNTASAARAPIRSADAGNLMTMFGRNENNDLARIFEPSRISASQNGRSMSLDELIKNGPAAWYPLDRQEEIRQIWSNLDGIEQDDTMAFLRYMVRLGDERVNSLVLKSDPAFREFVQAWLAQLSESADLRSDTFAAAFDATTTCGDRVIHTFNAMQAPRVAADVKKGKYDNDVLAVIEAGRNIFRREKIEERAVDVFNKILDKKLAAPEQYLSPAVRARIAQLDAADARTELRKSSEEIETHLRLLIDNVATLKLDLPIKGMRYPFCAGIAPEDVAAVANEVKKAENAGFTNWLVEWPVWNTFAQRVNADEYEKADDQRQEEVMAALATRDADNQADIMRMGISMESMTQQQKDDLYRGLEKARFSDISMKSLKPMTLALLENKGVADAVNPYWQDVAIEQGAEELPDASAP